MKERILTHIKRQIFHKKCYGLHVITCQRKCVYLIFKIRNLFPEFPPCQDYYVIYFLIEG